MKILITFLITLAVLPLNAQKYDDDIIKFLSGFKDITYVSGGEQEKAFYNLNEKTITKLSDEIASLPIDRCKSKNINIVFLIDTSGYTHDVLIVSGSLNKKLDSLITEKVKLLNGLWNPIYEDGIKVNFLSNISVVLLNNHSVTRSTRTENNKSYKFGVEQEYTSITQVKGADHDKSCADSNFYYEQGIQEISRSNYKKAANYFSKSILINPYFTDALYNYAVVCFKLNKHKEACESLQTAVYCGDEEAGILLNKMCIKKE